MEKNILVTGFRAIEDHSVSSIQKFLEHYCVLGNCTIRSLIFPPYNFSMGAENFGQKIIEKAKTIEAAAIISLGMLPEVKGLRIERKALNWTDSESVFRSEGDRKLNVNYQPWHFKEVNLQRWDLNSMLEKLCLLNIEFEKEISVSPSYYCGNALMYRTLEALELHSCNIPYLFINVPYVVKPIPETAQLIPTLETLRKIIAVASESYKGEPKALPCPNGA